MLHSRADETADSQIQFIPAVAHNVVNHRVQYTIVANASHAQSFSIQVNLKCTHRADILTFRAVQREPSTLITFTRNRHREIRGAHSMWYLILFGMFAAWVLFDGLSRKYGGAAVGWAFGTLFLGPLVVPGYLAKRPLKNG